MKIRLHTSIAFISLALVVAAWFGGSLRQMDAVEARVRAIRPDITAIQKMEPGLYEGRNAQNQPLYIALESHPGYGGPVLMAIVVNTEKRIETVAIVESAETGPYLTKIIEAAVPDAFLGGSIDKLPHVHAVSGATMSSEAVIRGTARAAAMLGAQRFGLPPAPEPPLLGKEDMVRLLVVAGFFIVALIVASKRFIWNKNRARLILLATSVGVLGFWYGSQFSLATVALFVSGTWLKGVASWAPLVCLLLAVAVLILTRKNLYCAAICPFGGIQEGLSRITACSPPIVPTWMVWASRLLTLAALCMALYCRSPSDATYEPFGKTFNGVGSAVLFALTVAVLLSSLVFKRPWCRLLCPITSLSDYVQFVRNRLSNKVAQPEGDDPAPQKNNGATAPPAMNSNHTKQE